MSKVLITGSADGLGREAAKQLVRGGHEVVLHARDEARAQQALAGVPGAAAALPGDLSSIASTRVLAYLINAAGVFDAIIHNAGTGYREPTRRETEDGLEHVFHEHGERVVGMEFRGPSRRAPKYFVVPARNAAGGRRRPEWQ